MLHLDFIATGVYQTCDLLATFVWHCAGLLEPSAGQVAVCGLDLSQHPDACARLTGICPQVWCCICNAHIMRCVRKYAQHGTCMPVVRQLCEAEPCCVMMWYEVMHLRRRVYNW